MLSYEETIIYDYLKTLAQTDLSSTEFLCTKATSSVGDATAAVNFNDSDTASTRPRLAWVSPFPPARTGVAEYSAQIMSGLRAYFDVTPVYPDSSLERPDDLANAGPDGCMDGMPLSSFYGCYEQFDRVVYNLGNSAFHTQITRTALLFPGIVLMHDVYLGHCLAALATEMTDNVAGRLIEEEGLGGLLSKPTLSCAVDELPHANSVLRHAQHLLVHSHHAQTLLLQQYPLLDKRTITVMPHGRRAPDDALTPRDSERTALGVGANELLYISLGHINPLKGHLKLVEAFALTHKAVPNAVLHLVGSCYDAAFKAKLLERLEFHDLHDCVVMTGYADDALYSRYLRTADVAVQLREQTRGETSGAVTDCLANALATVVSDMGSFGELPDDVVIKIAPSFDASELAMKLITLADTGERQRLSQAARAHFLAYYALDAAIPVVADAIKGVLPRASIGSAGALARPILAAHAASPTSDDFRDLAIALADTVLAPAPRKRLFVDVSSIEVHDLRTGIQRVVRALTLALANDTEHAYTVIPVRLQQTSDGRWCYSVASQFVASLLPESDFSWPQSNEACAIHPAPNDVVLCLDLTGLLLVQAAEAGFYEALQGRSVRVIAAVYDLLPITLPQVFPSGAEAQHTQWLHAITGFDQAVCISAHVAQQVRKWLAQHAPDCCLAEPGRVTSWCLGSDISASQPTRGLLADMTGLDTALSTEPCLLMVGTIEPRKGYDDVLDAMELLWRAGNTTPLIVVGRAGWRHLPPEERQHIDATCESMVRLAGQYPWMIWLNDASDELLDYVYTGASHVLCASVDEGFGLPIVEALKHSKRVLARDIPVFREVGGNAVRYLAWDSPDGLAKQLQFVCSEDRDGNEFNDSSLPMATPALMSWAESARQLLRALTAER